MKFQLSFLKGISIICLTLFLLFNCSKDVDVQTAEMPPPLTDVLTLEFSFGDENTITKNEFLLAQPRGIAVNSENDIFVVDEECVKVFDSNGKEKSIVGRPGQGPGEFSSAGAPVVSPDGYLAVVDGRSYNLFAPILTLIEKKNYRNDFNLTAFRNEHGYYFMFSPRRVYPIDEFRKILYFDSWKKLDDTPNIYKSPESRVPINDHFLADVLVYDNDGEYVELASYYPKDLNDKNLSVEQTPYGKQYEKHKQQGHFFCVMLPGNRIIYTHPVFDTRTVNSGSEYILHIVDLETLKKIEISRKYNPGSTKEALNSGIYKNEESIRQDAEKRKYEYFYPLHRLLADGETVFLFLQDSYNQSRYEFKEGVEVKYLVEVLDAGTGEFLRSVYFPFIPNVIKNGYAFKFNDWINNNEFPKVEKYKIDPAVYGK